MPTVRIGHVDVLPLFWDISHKNGNGDFHPSRQPNIHFSLKKELR